MSQLPTLNQCIEPGGYLTQSVPAYSTVADNKNQQPPQQIPPN